MTPELRAAEKRLDTAQTRYDAARARWEAVASAHHSARAAGAQTVLGADGELREISHVDPASIHELAKTEEAAREERDQAGAELVECRMAHRNFQATRGRAA